MADQLTIVKSEPLPGGGLSLVKSEPLPQEKPGFLGAFWEGIGGKALMDIMGGASRDPARAQKSLDTLKALGSGLVNEGPRIMKELDAAGEAIRNGDWGLAAHHAAGAAPLFGAAVQNAGAEWERGDKSEAAGHTAALFAPFLAAKAPALARAAADTDAGTATIGAVKGAAKAAVETKPVTVRGVEIPVPTTVASAAAGGAAASAVGLPRTMGAVAGAAVPIVRGAVTGAKAALAERLQAAIQDLKGPRVSQAEQQGVTLAPTPNPVPTFTPQQAPMGMDEAGNMRPGPLPSGRRVGTGEPKPVPPKPVYVPRPAPETVEPASGGQSAADMLRAELEAKRTPVAAAPVVPAEDTALLDDIAQGQTGKPFAKLAPAHQGLIRELAKRVKDAEQQPPPTQVAPVVQPPAAPAVVEPPAPVAQTEAPITPPVESRSQFHANGERKSPQFRAAEIKNGNIDAKGQRFAQAFQQAGISASDLANIPLGRVTAEEIAKGAVPGWGNITDELIASGVLEKGEVSPNESIPTIINYLRQMEKKK